MMKKALYACLMAASVVMLSATAASAQGKVRLTARLNGGEETPAPGLNTGAFGFAVVTVDSAAAEVLVELQVWNLPTGSTAGHIHAGSKGTPGPVILDFTFPQGLSGDFSQTFRLGQSALRARPEIGINTLADALQAVAAGNGYVNVHTTQYAGGEIRGQLVPDGSQGQQ